MASELDIANVALGHLGDDATVSNFNPPEGSAQAEHCARFYPLARDSLLEQHEWAFATTRAILTPLIYPDPEGKWSSVFALPNDYIKAIAISSNTSSTSILTSDPYTAGFIGSAISPVNGGSSAGRGYEYEVAADGSGNKVLMCNLPTVTLKYVRRITDTTRFSPLFVDTLGWYLASYLAGPVLKGEVGRAEAKACMQFAFTLMGKATISDANQRHTNRDATTPWINGR